MKKPKRLGKETISAALQHDATAAFESHALPLESGPMAEIVASSSQIAQLTAYAAIANGNAVVQRQPGTQNGLPANLKSGVESLSGIPMDDVQVHYNSSKPAQVQAHAYAQGTEIHLAPGQERHLAHEAWHVVQQKQGRVKPTLQLKGVTINDDIALEQEADEMGGKALESRQGAVQLKSQSIGLSPATPQLVQRVKYVAKQHKKLVEGLGEKLQEPDEDVQSCLEWAQTMKQFDAFTVDEKSFALYKRIRHLGISAVDIHDATNKTDNDTIEQSEQLIEVATQKAREKPKPKASDEEEKAPAKKGIPDELSFEMFGAMAPAHVRPASGNTMGHLLAIDPLKDHYPSTFADILVQVAAAGHITPIVVSGAVLLGGGKGTAKETVEVVVSAGGRDFVVHYHPRAVAVAGPLAGESQMHVKGSRAAKHHESMSDAFYASIGVPTLAAIIGLNLQ